MTPKALVVEDDERIIDSIEDALFSIGHEHDWATNQHDAQLRLKQSEYDYVLLDLQIPAKPNRGGANREFGCNLLRDIQRIKGRRRTPVIVMTAYSSDCLDLSTELQANGASEFIAKPFSSKGRTLASVIRKVLGDQTPKRFAQFGETRQERVSSFERGELVFFPTRVELCGVKICGDEDRGSIRKILDVLHGGRAYSGEELAETIGSEGGAPAVAGAIRNFRQRVCRVLRAEAGVQIDPASDLIVNDRQHGYRFSDKLTVLERTGLLSVDCEASDATGIATLDEPGEAPGDSLSQWILDELGRAGRLRRSQITARTGRSSSTLRRALAELRDAGQIVFEGSARAGHWRLM